MTTFLTSKADAVRQKHPYAKYVQRSYGYWNNFVVEITGIAQRALFTGNAD